MPGTRAARQRSRGSAVTSPRLARDRRSPRPTEAGESRSFVNSARRAQIVAAAIDTVAEVGCADASLARLAVRLGVSKGVISYRFAGKDDLIEQIITPRAPTGQGIHAASHRGANNRP